MDINRNLHTIKKTCTVRELIGQQLRHIYDCVFGLLHGKRLLFILVNCLAESSHEWSIGHSQKEFARYFFVFDCHRSNRFN